MNEENYKDLINMLATAERNYAEIVEEFHLGEYELSKVMKPLEMARDLITVVYVS